jgi:hypothetical protein
VVLVILILYLEKKVPERISGLRPSEKELSEGRSGVFRQKKCPCM